MKEVQYSTSSVGQIAYLLWKGVYPDDLTFSPHVACIYCSEDDFGELIGKYWKGTTIPACELSECVVIAQRIIDREEIDEDWFKDMKEAIKEVRQDYLGQLML
jgi:hypothetical protein